jgi:Zn-dependent peptidase ImmA (M78 family)
MTSTSTSRPADGRLSPSRIRLARERRGLSKVTLSSRLGLTTRALQTYETDGAPSSRAVDLARALGVEAGFFTRPERPAISVEQGFFRAPRRATAAQLGSARAAASIGIEVYEWLAERFTLPATVLPDLDQQDPEDAAATLRSMWGRGEEPLPNLIQLSEAHGVRVLSLPTPADTVDAFSLWLDGAPYVFLSTAKTAERSRFDLAHELGHLVMHSRVPSGTGRGRSVGPRLEREADAFAAAFLMPRRNFLAHAGREPAVPQILRLRDHYRVSALTTARRLHEVGRLTDWGYRQNCVQLAQRGFRSAEPGGMNRERSRVFGTVFPVLRERGSGTGDVCQGLGITPQELHGFTFGQVAVTISGGDEPAALPRPRLRVVGGSR